MDKKKQYIFTVFKQTRVHSWEKYIHQYVNTQSYTLTWTAITYTHIYINTYIHIHMYIYININTHKHIQKYQNKGKKLKSSLFNCAEDNVDGAIAYYELLMVYNNT